MEKGMKVYNVPVVFFDLDDSLINKDANSLWIRWRFRRDRWALVEAALALLSLYRAYKRGKVTHTRLSNYYRTRTMGMTLADYESSVERFFHERGQLHIYPQAASLLFAYQRQGTRIVLITGADEVVANAYGRELGVDDVISNRFDTVNDTIRGLRKPLCYGKGKVEMAKRYLEGTGIRLGETAFYSDSHADLPLFEEVGHPIVLNPNAILTSVAAERSWPVLDWR
jgi:HAD superfamily hydrolase (TIGR01490 family)|tara:strand:+ start:2833 stop:3510 length:678 start_codon:yes stop_codon:yes gene_type:complete